MESAAAEELVDQVKLVRKNREDSAAQVERTSLAR
jgi:hypothetical protein